MSIEEQVGRIAGALERIATVLEHPVQTFTTTETTPTPTPAPTVPAPEPEKKTRSKKPKVDELDSPISQPPPVMAQSPANIPVDLFEAGNESKMTAEELRILAQQVAAKMGTNIIPFTTFVRDELCPRMGCQRLIEVSPEMTNEAAQMIKDWAKKVGVNV
jgi:hypothetical protein